MFPNIIHVYTPVIVQSKKILHIFYSRKSNDNDKVSYWLEACVPSCDLISLLRDTAANPLRIPLVLPSFLDRQAILNTHFLKNAYHSHQHT